MRHHPAHPRSRDPLEILASYHVEELERDAAHYRLLRQARSAGTPEPTRPALFLRRLAGTLWSAVRRAPAHRLGLVRATTTPAVPREQ